MLEGALSRGDRRLADAVELAYLRGSRLESLVGTVGRSAVVEGDGRLRLDRDAMIHAPYNIGDRLPWDHINVKKGRTFLEKGKRVR